MSEHETVQVIITSTEYFLLGLTIVLGGLSTILIQFGSKRWSNRNTRFDIVEGLLLELNATAKSIRVDNFETFNEETILQSAKKDRVKTTRTEIDYLTHSFFDTIVNSGQILLLDSELRNELTEVYELINASNFHTNQLVKMSFLVKYTPEMFANYKVNFELQKNTLQDHRGTVLKAVKDVIVNLKKIEK
jgi:hypothetical protein